MRTFATFAILAATIAAECWESQNEYGKQDTQCDGEWTECETDCWDYNGNEVCSTWCWENDSPLEIALDGVSDAIRDIGDAFQNPGEVAEQMERGLTGVMEDIECWWADREPTTSCAKWEREAEIDACYDTSYDHDWNWEENYCMDEEETQEYNYNSCQKDIMEGPDDDGCTAQWNDEYKYCFWSCPDEYLNLKKDLNLSENPQMVSFLRAQAKDSETKRAALRHLQSMESTMISIDLDLAYLEEIEQRNQQASMETMGTLTGFYEQFNQLMNEWGPTLGEAAMKQQQAGEQIALEVAGLISSSVSVDGVPLAQLIDQMNGGTPEDWLMARRVSSARDVRSLFALDHVVLQAPTNVKVDIAFDTARLDELIYQTMDTATSVQENVEGALNDFFGQLGEIAATLEDDFEDIGEDAENALNQVGDFVKSTIMDESNVKVEYTSTNTNTTLIPPPVMPTVVLAQKNPKTMKQGTNYSKAAAGATFGVIALFAAVGLVANQKKTVRDHEESLL